MSRSGSRLVRAAMTFAVVTLAVVVGAQTAVEPPRLDRGEPPLRPVRTAAGGRAALRVSVDESGDVQRLVDLGVSSPFSEALRRAVGSWSFTPARVDGVPGDADVLVVGLFRPAALFAPPTLDRPLRVLDQDLPGPTRTPVPPYPPRAQGDGVVLLELVVDARGSVAGVRTIAATPGFASAAEETVRTWELRPAMRDGRPATSLVYVTVSSPEPVVTP